MLLSSAHSMFLLLSLTVTPTTRVQVRAMTFSHSSSRLKCPFPTQKASCPFSLVCGDKDLHMKQHQHRNYLTKTWFNRVGSSNTWAAIVKRKMLVWGEVNEAGNESCYFALILTADCFNLFNTYNSSVY